MKTNGVSAAILLNLSILFISIYSGRYSLEIIIARIGMLVRPTPADPTGKESIEFKFNFYYSLKSE